MTNDDSRPPMEWWLDLDKHYIGDLAEDGLVHVIEKSAYDALAKELTSARAEINQLTYELDKSRDSHVKIIQSQSALIERCEEALEWEKSRCGVLTGPLKEMLTEIASFKKGEK